MPTGFILYKDLKLLPIQYLQRRRFHLFEFYHQPPPNSPIPPLDRSSGRGIIQPAPDQPARPRHHPPLGFQRQEGGDRTPVLAWHVEAVGVCRIRVRHGEAKSGEVRCRFCVQQDGLVRIGKAAPGEGPGPGGLL